MWKLHKSTNNTNKPSRKKYDFETNNTLNKIVLFKENLPEPTLAAWIVFKVEFVKTMKRTFVRMDI